VVLLGKLLNEFLVLVEILETLGVLELKAKRCGLLAVVRVTELKFKSIFLLFSVRISTVNFLVKTSASLFPNPVIDVIMQSL
jgi:hypothetical protein